MALSEFQLIKEFFTATSNRSDVVQGVGDEDAVHVGGVRGNEDEGGAP
jgi:thiamine monophosphate kinase